ncbi:MAG: hypothetical protein P1U60_12075 [Hyphomonas sp.]|nr:hypothetical protein [Hyphomonas sp.]MDF1807104.1 hypothetical protein [Hyphomonas sp.]
MPGRQPARINLILCRRDINELPIIDSIFVCVLALRFRDREKGHLPLLGDQKPEDFIRQFVHDPQLLCARVAKRRVDQAVSLADIEKFTAQEIDGVSGVSGQNRVGVEGIGRLRGLQKRVRNVIYFFGPADQFDRVLVVALAHHPPSDIGAQIRLIGSLARVSSESWS